MTQDAITCDGCGACCLEQGSPPGYFLIHRGMNWPIPEDVRRYRRLPRALKEELDRYRARPPTHDQVCIWYDLQAGRCKHYELRPQDCRDLEIGGDACMSWRKRYSITVNGAEV